MRSSEQQTISPVIKEQLSQPKARKSVWGRMLTTGALVGALISSPFMIADAGERKNKKRTEKPTTAVKAITIEGSTRSLSITTKDHWDYVSELWDDGDKYTISLAKILEGFDGIFVKRDIIPGSDKCYSYLIQGESRTFGLVLVPLLGSSGKRAVEYIDTEIPVDDTSIIFEQSKLECVWTIHFSKSKRLLHRLKISESGEILEDKQLASIK